MNEEWKPVVEYEELYEVSTFGKVRSKINDIVLKEEIHYRGYRRVCLCKDGTCTKLYIHRIVAITFIPNPRELLVVNHINRKKHDNRLENLEWCTQYDNVMHAINDEKNPAANIPF